MACRECGGATCACSYSAGPGIALSGSGSATDPLIPAVQLQSNSGLFVTGAGLASQRWRIGTTAERTVATPVSEGDWWDDTTQRRIYRRTSGAWTLVHRYGAPGPNVGQPSFRLVRTAALSIANNTTTEITFDGESLDTEGAFTPPATRYTIPAGLTGWWALFGEGTWAAAPGLNSFSSITRGGARFGAQGNVGDVSFQSSLVMRLTGGQQMGLACYQISGAALNLTAASFEGVFLGT